jgi:hypothetical protein
MAATETKSTDKSEIRAIKSAVRGMRQKFWNEKLTSGGVSQKTQRQLAAWAIVYRDALVDFRGEKTLRPAWNERELDWVMNYVDQTVRVPESSPGLTSGGRSDEIPAITQVDPRRLYRLTKELDQVYHDLGLGPEVDDGDRPIGIIPYNDGDDNE